MMKNLSIVFLVRCVITRTVVDSEELERFTRFLPRRMGVPVIGPCAHRLKTVSEIVRDTGLSKYMAQKLRDSIPAHGPISAQQQECLAKLSLHALGLIPKECKLPKVGIVRKVA